MKGQTTIELDGQKIPIKLTLGVTKFYQKWAKKNNVDNPDNDPEAQLILFALMEIFATEKWKEAGADILEMAEKEAFKFHGLSFSETLKISEITEEIASGKVKKATKKT